MLSLRGVENIQTQAKNQNAKWITFSQVANDISLNKKLAPNHKYLEAIHACNHLLHTRLQTNFNECVGQIIIRWMFHNLIKK